MSPIPLYFKDAAGPRLWDVDGNEYVDYALAWGPLILGHKHPRIVEAMRAQAGKPHIYGAQHELEFQVAEKIQSLVPCAERVAFTSSGSEAVQLALRLARTSTGRNLIVRFEGHYHGWMDSVLVGYRPAADQMGPIEEPSKVLGSAGQTPNAVDNVLVASWNHLPFLENLFTRYGEQIAAVITEPVLCNAGNVMPLPGYLDGLRRLTQQHGALLIFDEVITGFRIALGGAQAHFGVVPDLSTLGKALAGGVTLSAVAGRAEIMELMLAGGVSFGGTFNGNPMSLAAAQATLEELSRDDGSALARANATGQRLMQEIRGLAAERGLPLLVTGFGASFSLHFTPLTEIHTYRDTLRDNQAALRQFLRLALDEGIYLLPDGRFYVSAVHTEKEEEQTVQALRRAFNALW
jgi:glutamate-1-semialdehyde 2,1-aminomutase